MKPDCVLVNGTEERHPEGNYVISWYEGKRQRRVSVGKDPVVAVARQLAKQAELNALNHGVSVTPEVGRVPLSTAISEFLEETRLTKKDKTLAAYTIALKYFRESCPKVYLDEIDRQDMLRFTAFLRDSKEQAPRSVYNKFENVMTFLKANGMRGLVSKNDWPKFTQEEPEIYEKEELEALFAVCDAEEKTWFQFFLKTGMREQEVMHMYWRDVNLRHATVRVSHKPERKWTPKAYKEREIPIPAALVKLMKAWKARANGCKLLFPTSGDGVKLDFLDRLKACAERAGLDPENFWLHKFRSTFATRNLWAGVDLRTVQNWLGHVDLESTLRYLKPARGKEVHSKVNEVWKDEGGAE